MSAPSIPALLSALREEPVVGPGYVAVHGRMAERLATSLASLPLQAARSGSGAAPISRVAFGAKKIVAWLAVTFAAGVVSGVCLDRWIVARAPEPRLSAPASVSSVIRVEPALVAPLASVSDAPAPDDLRVARPSPAHSAPPADGGSTLAAEQGLLDAARQLLARGEPEGALAPLERHATRFPSGILSEEREALAIRALAALSRDEEAATRASSFHRSFSNSLFAPIVDAAVSKIPRRNEPAPSKP